MAHWDDPPGADGGELLAEVVPHFTGDEAC